MKTEARGFLMALSLCLAGCQTPAAETNETLLAMQNLVFELGEPVYLKGDWLAEASCRQHGGSLRRSEARRIEAGLPSGFQEQAECSALDQSLHSPECGWLKAGLYPILLKDGSQVRTLEIQVQDTTPPVFLKPETKIYTEKGSAFRLKQQVKTDDYSDVTLRAWGLLDTDLPGIYPCRIQAEDASGNESFLDVTVVVVDPLHPLDEMPEFRDYAHELEQ